MRTADHVLHKPSGETWVVAYVDGDDLVACGWPLSVVLLVSDCELVKAATDEENEKLLKEMSVMLSGDPRCYYAKAELLRRRQLEEVRKVADPIRILRMTIETEDGENITLSVPVSGEASYVPTNKGGYVVCNCVFRNTSMSWTKTG